MPANGHLWIRVLADEVPDVEMHGVCMCSCVDSTNFD